ncbi:hypothetical protein BSKO_10062 [Bryopsis sp. KO-2023]|nr:hypothetical protein BSKO_10062 [Bryopsis sp. KO-2023]
MLALQVFASLVYALVLFGYFYARVVYTLDVEWVWYGAVLLAAELFCSLGTLFFVLSKSNFRKVKGVAEEAAEEVCQEKFSVRVLIHCSKENLGVLEETVRAAVDADLPPGSKKSVYVVDASGDSSKEAWVENLDRSLRVTYICTQRQNANIPCSLNEALGVIYGGQGGPLLSEEQETREITAVIGASQIVRRNFFTKLLPSLETHALVLNPRAAQVTSRKSAGEAVSQERWTLPVLEAWGCGGWSKTNFLVDSSFLHSVGTFNAAVETEDYALWVSTIKSGQTWGWYDECLADREETRVAGVIFADRKHWCKGHMQLFFSLENPVFCSSLTVLQKISLIVAPWTQLASAMCIPLAVVVPVLSIWFGICPADFNHNFAFGFALHYVVAFIVVYAGFGLEDTIHVWLANMSEYAFWSAYMVAILEVFWERLRKAFAFCCCCCGASGSQTKFMPLSMEDSRDSSGNTGKQAKSDTSTMTSSALVHILLLASSICMLVVSAIAGGVLLATGHDSLPYFGFGLRASIVWSVLNIIPFSVLVSYLARRKVGRRDEMAIIGFIGAILSACLVGSLIHNHRSGYDYHDVLTKSLLFYEAQRSGDLPDSNRVSWRRDSALHDITVDGTSLTGGYYDAGDTVKFGLPLGVSLTMLSWGLLEFRENYERTNELDNARNAIKWGTDYILKCHTGENEFYAQVGYGTVEHTMWGRPEELFANYVRVGQMLNETHPGSDILGSSAAALASAHIVFKDVDPEYANTLLDHAKDLYLFGKTYTGLSSDNLNDCKPFYHSQEFRDDLAMGAMWLYKATGDREYLLACEKHLDSMSEEMGGITPYFGWENVGAGVSVLLAQETGHHKYISEVDSHLRNWIYDITYTPGGLAWLTEWGSLRFDANTAFLAFVHAKHVMEHSTAPFENMRVSTFQCWAMFQIRYLLGDGGRSFVVGVGRNYPKFVHHRGASCPDYPEPCGWDQFHSKEPNPQLITGGLVGGPDQNGNYDDNRENYKQNEVALDYNAGFTGAVAALVSMSENSAYCYHGVGIFETLKRF